MGILFRPDRDRRESVQELARNAGVLLGFMGWATIALGLSTSSIPVFFGLAGGIAAVMQQRFFRATGLAEVAVIAVIINLVPDSALEWVWVGAATSAFGRVLAIVFQARAKIDGGRE